MQSACPACQLMEQLSTQGTTCCGTRHATRVTTDCSQCMAHDAMHSSCRTCTHCPTVPRAEPSTNSPSPYLRPLPDSCPQLLPEGTCTSFTAPERTIYLACDCRPGKGQDGGEGGPGSEGVSASMTRGDIQLRQALQPQEAQRLTRTTSPAVCAFAVGAENGNIQFEVVLPRAQAPGPLPCAPSTSYSRKHTLQASTGGGTPRGRGEAADRRSIAGGAAEEEGEFSGPAAPLVLADAVVFSTAHGLVALHSKLGEVLWALALPEGQVRARQGWAGGAVMRCVALRLQDNQRT